MHEETLNDTFSRCPGSRIYIITSEMRSSQYIVLVAHLVGVSFYKEPIEGKRYFIPLCLVYL